VRKDLPHLLPALIAFLFFTGVLWAGTQYAQSMENRHVRAFAPMLLPQTLNGSALQQAALRRPDLLPVYGSSELFHENTPYRAFLFFSTYPSGFMVFEVARSAATSLIIAEDLAALGPELRGKKVVISFTPSMFNAGEVSPTNYEGNYTQLHGDALIFNPYLSLQVKQQAARRMLDYPNTLTNDPILKFAAINLSSPSTIQQTLYYLALPLGQLETLIVRLQDHWQVLNIIWSKPGLTPTVLKKTVSIQWNADFAQAKAEQIAKANNNPYGIENNSWTQRWQKLMEKRSAPPGSRDASFVGRLDTSREWSDLEIVLEILKEMGAQPLIMSRPINGPLWTAMGVSREARQVYYDRLHKIVVDTYGMPLVDFENHDGDRYFSTDSASHTSRLGWVYVDQTLDAFFHGNIH